MEMSVMGVRFVAEYYDVGTGEVVESKTLRSDEIKKPHTLKELGYLHSEQIQLLKAIQDFKLFYETKLINEDLICPNCGRRASRRGIRKSNFHAVLTDHEIKIQRCRCRCGWGSPDSVEGLYGSALHPDLVEKQMIQGAENSYRQASRHLNAESKTSRSINNVDRIRRTVSKVAKIIEKNKLKTCKAIKQREAIKQLIAVIDGGHLKSNDNDSRSFEAMIATVYCPNNIRRIDKHHKEITQKTSVASALSDEQKTIKQLTLNACRKEGMNARVTELTCLTDGANNCWSIANSLRRYCKKLINVLDWFHITKRFTIINNRVDSDFKDKLEKVKWFLWHGEAQKGLERLAQLQLTITDGKNNKDEKLASDLKDLYEYLERNQKYIVNYQKRRSANLPFTSTYAESSVNEIINFRQKNNKKMQWSREGAHNILQIRTSQFSKTLEQDWEKAQESIYLKIA
jgi:hypothetical protein